MNGSPPSWLLTAIFVPVVGLLLYRRFRTSFGRQPVSVPRMAIRLALLTLIGTTLLVTVHTLATIGAAAVGLVLGVGLAYFGVEHTRLERTPLGTFYTPNKWIGLTVTALLVGRLAARMFMAYAAVAARAANGSADGPASMAGAQQNPLTLGLFFLMTGYYGAYYVAIWWKARQLPVSEPLPPA